ncbi:hypothetical protein QWZ13_17375 [Reinekea marina]|nr:hypothetical protein [Reinekea marina]MDN3647371.1 hypothetical protein [Reinekea marina]MDN3648753.1 hypothetical protein [Reinekea marina]MDN3649768.1 hypothetical protein [Reinekea marina]MDN3650680.1 hypothetical protein [Reinekea marina]
MAQRSRVGDQDSKSTTHNGSGQKATAVLNKKPNISVQSQSNVK